MKKLFLALTVLSLAFTGCSDDDAATTNNPDDLTFTSSLVVDGQAFTPSPNSAMSPSVMTTFTADVNNGEDRARTFHLMKTGTSISELKGIMLSVIYPNTQASINGTYSFDLDNWEDSITQAMYMEGQSAYSFQSGTVTVTDQGDSKYKLVFNNVTAVNLLNEASISVSGSFEGTFILSDE